MSHTIRAIFAATLFTLQNAEAGGSKKPRSDEVPMGSSNDPKSDQKPNKSQPDAVPQQLLVAFQDAKASASRQAIFRKYDAREIEKVGSTELYLIELPAKADLKSAQSALTKEKGVRYAEPNLRMRTFKN